MKNLSFLICAVILTAKFGLASNIRPIRMRRDPGEMLGRFLCHCPGRE